MYRFSLILFGLAWVFVASTLCGCSAANGWVMNRSGQSYFDRGDYTAARHEFERAMMDSPNNPNYAFNLAQAMEQEGDMQGAEQMYQHALNVDPSHQPSYHSLSAMLVDEGREEDARALLSSWAETQPYLPESQLAMAEMYETDGNYLAAQQYTQRALAMKPRDARAMKRMGRIYQQSGNPQLAQQWYGQSLVMNPYQPNLRAQAQSLHGPQMSPAQQMAASRPRFDPSFAGGYQFTQPGYTQAGMPPTTHMSSPMPMGSPMVSNQWSTQPTMNSGWMPTGSVPTTTLPGQVTTQPMPMVSQQMIPQQMATQFDNTTVYESPPSFQENHIVNSMPMETQVFESNPTLAAPMVSSVPAVRAF